MARVNTYLNFQGDTEKAFNYYKEIFGTEFISITRIKDMPRPEGAPALQESDANKIMNINVKATGFVFLLKLASKTHTGSSSNARSHTPCRL